MSTSPSPPLLPPPRPSTSMAEVKATWEAGWNDIQHFTTLKPLVNHDNYVYYIPKLSDPKSTEYVNWVKKDNHAQVYIMQCIDESLVVQVGSLSSSYEIWLALKQECLSTLKKLDFDISSYLKAALLLATLPTDPKDSQSWYSFIHAQLVNKETKLSDIVSSICKATHADAAIAPQSGSAVKSALATLKRDAREKSKYWCMNCRKGGYTKSYCTEPGGGRAGKRNKKKGKGSKGKEKAHAVEDSGRGEVFNVVLANLDLALNSASLHYDVSIVKSPSTHSHSIASDEAYLASMSSSGKSFIIDSGSFTHLHSSHFNFATYSATSGVITGSKAGHSSKVKLKHMAFVPDASALLISVAWMDEDSCYTILGNGKSLCFQLDDSGELLHHLSASENIVFTGMKNCQHLYTLDSPDSSTPDVVFLTCKYASTLNNNSSGTHWSYFLKQKTANEVSSVIKKWIWKIEHLTGQKLKCFHSNGGEQNAVSESFNCTSAGLVHTVLINSKLPLFLWNKAWWYAGYCLNHAMQGLSCLKEMTAHQILTDSKAHGCDFHPFGCKAYVFDRNQKAYRVYLPGKHTMVTLIHIKFDHLSFFDASIRDKEEYKWLYNMFTGLQSNNADSVSINDDGIDTPSAPSLSPSASDPVKPPSPVPTSSAPKLEQPSTPTPSLLPPLPAQHSKAMPKSWPDSSVPPLHTCCAAAKEVTASSEGDAQPEILHAAVLSVGDNSQTLAQALNSSEHKYWIEAIEEEL
ncbi:retroelement pol polyprotein [Moniliophthora roreri MCA 2997]|uniref:Retroelement pol polyprotein n=1 Tax=Moniliophthora roreri (strain MCA 2997) TaxID=1381753 RepID=V2WPT9_MONRO|nr:retroelement pol polyprotein [Moniliophthora roreri MCA 2997]